MKRISFVVFAAIVCVCLSARSDLGGLVVSAQPAGSAADEVLRVVRTDGDATVKKDRAALEKVRTDDYSYVHSNGVVDNKAQEIASSMSGDAKWTSLTLTDLKARVYGDAAIVTGVETLLGTAKGYVPGARRLTDVWVKRNGQWQTVGGQSTIVSKDASSTAAQSALKAVKAKPAATKTPDEKAVSQADDAFARADLDANDAKAKALQTKDYSFVSRQGQVAAPSDPPGPKHKSNIVAYDRVSVYGTLAVVQGSLLWTDVEGFSPGVLRFTRVWVKEGNAWKLAAEQRTPIAAARPAG